MFSNEFRSIRFQLKHALQLTIIAFLAAVLTGCELVGDIFGAGVYTGIFIVVFIILIIGFMIIKIRKGIDPQLNYPSR